MSWIGSPFDTVRFEPKLTRSITADEATRVEIVVEARNIYSYKNSKTDEEQSFEAGFTLKIDLPEQAKVVDWHLMELERALKGSFDFMMSFYTELFEEFSLNGRPIPAEYHPEIFKDIIAKHRKKDE